VSGDLVLQPTKMRFAGVESDGAACQKHFTDGAFGLMQGALPLLA
jgi:hypothetical protein